MKNKLMKHGMVILCLLLQYKSSAQTLIPPTPSADILWSTSTGSGIWGLNTALIDIPDYDSLNSPPKQLAACAFNRGYGEVLVTDMRSGFTVPLVYGSTGYSGTSMGSQPDVILGNKAGSSTDFIMAVAFVSNSGSPQVEIDYFDISYTSSSVFTVTYNTSSFISPPIGGSLLYTVHIDVVAQSGTLSNYNMPFCDEFFVTWDGHTGAYNVFSSYGTLNSYSLLAGPQNISFGASPTVDSYLPDVAAVERGTGGSTYPVALFAHTSHSNNILYYQEWRDPLGSPLVTTAAVLDATLSSYVFYYPRIGANDDYNTNSGISCQSKVVCETYGRFSLSGMDVGIYSPLGSGGFSTSWIDVSSLEYPLGSSSYPFGSPAYLHYAPAVAYAPNGSGSQYMVTEGIFEGTLGDFCLMSPIGGGCGSGLAPAPSTALDYFVVNSTYPAAMAPTYENSVSTPCNNPSDTSLVAWVHNGAVFYKRSGYGSGTGYAYRPGTTTEASSSSQEIVIYPNPSTDQIRIRIPGEIKSHGYSIGDMTGRVVKDGTITTSEQEIDISALPNGAYQVSLFSEGIHYSPKLFTKY